MMPLKIYGSKGFRFALWIKYHFYHWWMPTYLWEWGVRRVDKYHIEARKEFKR